MITPQPTTTKSQESIVAKKNTKVYCGSGVEYVVEVIKRITFKTMFIKPINNKLLCKIYIQNSNL